MNFICALMAVLVLTALGLAGPASPGLRFALVVITPYVAMAVFIVGVFYRMMVWARAAVPFRIPTTSGQQKSLPWIKSGRLESPCTSLGVVGRMALEILLFRSLFRNNKAELRAGGGLVFAEEKFLWLGALAFHWSLLIVILRHLRLFLNPVPAWVVGLQSLDGFFQVSMPVLYLSDGILWIALGYLLLRRLGNAQVRYISLFTDYFALCLLLCVVTTGSLMRYAARVEMLPIKEFALSLASFSPRMPAEFVPLFGAHVFLVSVLLAYFPFSKLMHMGGVFLSPTRNLANNNRMKRHVNPWDYPVEVHTYAEWEEEYHAKIKAAGLPLEGS
jgi:nitrate reductase gamma subunit